MKTCTKCLQEKAPAHFHSDIQKKDGLASACRACHSAASAARYAARNTPERQAERAEAARQWRAENPEANRVYVARWRRRNVAHVQAQSRRWHAAHPGYAAQHRQQNRARYQENARRRQQANPLAARAYTAAYRARKRQAPGTYTADDVKHLFRVQRGKCAGCRARLRRYHVDHIQALARGGTNDRLNLQLLCPPCNQAKGVRHPVDFMRSKGYLL